MRKSNEAIPRPIIIALRPATIEDAAMVFEWRNDNDVRAISESKKKLTMQKHMKWFAERLPLTHPESIWMAMRLLDINDSEGAPIGTARILLDGKDHARISLVIARQYRQRGIGRQVIKLLKEKIEAMNRIAVARVQTKNLYSLRAFMSQGFHVVASEEAFVELHAYEKMARS